MHRLLAVLIAVLVLTLSALPAAAQTVAERVTELASGSYDEKEAAIRALGDTGEAAAAPALAAMAEGLLFVRKTDGKVVIGEEQGRRAYRLHDPLTNDEIGEATSRELEKIRVNNRLRRAIEGAIGRLTLFSPDPGTRRAAAASLLQRGRPDALPLLGEALAKENDPGIVALMQQARAAIIVNSDMSDAAKVEAIKTLAERGGRDTLGLLTPLASGDGAVAKAADEAVRQIEADLRLWEAGQNLVYGVSLGSVLLLAAIGLAITFGVMGVINMAHGEVVMLGAYTAFVVQDLIRDHAPALFDASILIAIPVAFLFTGAVGVLIEKTIIRFLYGRPLETLLATWGLSLVIQQAVRTVFGPTNQEVGNPSWLSGAVQVGGLTLTWNRIWIVAFALLVFACLILVLRFTRLGLQMRAVTQNRRMAASMGIRTGRIDALTFGLGSGIAGIAGVALSQIDNVSPNLGQGYIIDSFMVVVFGGVGNLWGTLVGALSLGVLNKFLEPYAGAVLGKILVLVLIILFIQKRPRGLFALKGRALEA